MDNQHRSPEHDISQDMSNQVSDAGKKVGKKVGKKATKMAKKAGTKVAKKAGAIVMKTLGAVLIKIAPFLLVAGFILLVIVGGWYLLFETRGAEQNYSMEKDVEKNPLAYTEKGYFASTDLSGKNKAIVEFYRYFGQNAFFQILTDDHTKLEQNPEVRDYYQKEKTYSINPNFLWALDEFAYKGAYRYPEQFVKPINYDPDTLTLKQLTDDKGMLIAESTKYDDKGMKTNDKILGVHDYGMASIFKYKPDKRTVTVEGNYTMQDVFDPSCECVVQQPINEPFKETLSEEDIWIITKAVTFVGEFEFVYEDKKTPIGGLVDDVGEEKSDKAKIHYQTYEHWVEECTASTDPETGEEIESCTDVLKGTYELYKYREGQVYETLPVEDPSQMKENKVGDRYLRDYLYFFLSWVPESVMEDFNFHERVGTLINFEIETGSKLDSVKFKKSMEYYDIAVKYGTQYGVDPYLLIAKMAQESGGDRFVNEKGLMQIIKYGGTWNRTITATDLAGNKETFTITKEMRSDPDASIKWATMYMSNLLKMFDGDQLKALLAYNMGEGTVKWIKNNHPEAWETSDWMNYIGMANEAVLGGKGDNEYLPHVLQYYAGEQYAGLDEHSKQDPSLGEKILNFFGFGIEKKEYGEDEPHIEFKHYMGKKEVDWLLRSIKTFDGKVLFSETELDSEMSFWEDGFTASMSYALDAQQFLEIVGEYEYISPVNLPNVKDLVTSRFGPRWGKIHRGTDVGIPVGTPIYAIADGTVVRSVGDQNHSKESWGNYVKIRHDGNHHSLYAHLDAVAVPEGATVVQGQLIGYSGNTGNSTGPHLHFEYYLGSGDYGKQIDSYWIVVNNVIGSQ